MVNGDGKKPVIPMWLSNNAGLALVTLVFSACLVILDSRHVTASEFASKMAESQSTILIELAKISSKMDSNLVNIKVDMVKNRIADMNSQLEELQLYIDEAPGSNLTNARKQNIRRLENDKEEAQVEQRMLSRKDHL